MIQLLESALNDLRHERNDMTVNDELNALATIVYASTCNSRFPPCIAILTYRHQRRRMPMKYTL